MSTPLSPEQRIDRLKLYCRLDRLNYRLLIHPRAPRTQGILGGLSAVWLREFASFAQMVPGRIGRWSRRFSLGFMLVERVRQALQKFSGSR